MRTLLPAILIGSIVALSGCADLEGLAEKGVAEGRVQWQRLNAWIEEGNREEGGGRADGDPGAVRVNDPRSGSGAADDGGRGRPGAGSAEQAGSSVARERFVASYALLGCVQAATGDPAERERRRTELFRVLGYTNFAWLDDLQRFGVADGDALKALCRP